MEAQLKKFEKEVETLKIKLKRAGSEKDAAWLQLEEGKKELEDELLRLGH